MSEIEIKKVAEKALKTTDNLGIATEKAKGIALKAKEKVSKMSAIIPKALLILLLIKFRIMLKVFRRTQYIFSTSRAKRV